MTAPVNYYDTLDSFIEAKGKAKSFNIIVETKTGMQVTSSALPISFLEAMLVTLENADASRTAFSIWDRKSNLLVLIPHDNIRHASIAFIE